MKADLPAPGPERVWLVAYPAGVPAEVDWRATPSLKHLVERSCTRFADKPAFTSLGTSVSYCEFERLSPFPAPKRWLVNGVVRHARQAVPPFVLENARRAAQRAACRRRCGAEG